MEDYDSADVSDEGAMDHIQDDFAEGMEDSDSDEGATGTAQERHAEEEDGGSESNSETGSDSDSGDDAGGLLDVEASESDGDGDSDDDHSERDGEEGLLDGTSPSSFWDGVDFPQFSRLPPELRARVWHYFFESVVARPRVLEFKLVTNQFPGAQTPSLYQALPGPTLATQIQPVCAMLSVNHESRVIALKAFPDKLSFEGKGASAVPFDKSTDVVVLSILQIYEGFEDVTDLRDSGPFAQHVIPGFSEQIKHLALQGVEINEEGGLETVEQEAAEGLHLWSFLLSFENLEAVYETGDNHSFASRQIHWCGSEDAVNVYSIVHSEPDEAGISRDIPITTVWPDLKNHREFATTTIRPQVRDFGVMASEFVERYTVLSDFSEKLAGVELWPMIQFWGRSGQRHLEKLRSTDFDELPEEDEEEGSDESGDDREADWSEDSEMDDFIDDYGEYGDHHEGYVIADFIEQERMGMDSMAYSGRGGAGFLDFLENRARRYSQMQEDEEDEALDDDGLRSDGLDEFNGFSPIDDSDNEPGGGPSTSTNGVMSVPDDDDDDGDEEAPARPAKRQKSRQVVSDDDADEEDEEPRPAKRARTRQVISSDGEDEAPEAASDEEDQPPQPTKRRRPHVVESDKDGDGEDDEGDDADSSPVHTRKRKRAAPPAPHSDEKDSESEEEAEEESSSDGSDSSDDEGGGSRPLTLAEKLGMHRRANPVRLSSDDEDGPSSDTGQRGGGYGRDEDDEEGWEEEEEADNQYDGYPDDLGYGDEDDDEEI